MKKIICGLFSGLITTLLLYPQTHGAPGANDNIMTFLPLIVIAIIISVVIYKKRKNNDALLQTTTKVRKKRTASFYIKIVPVFTIVAFFAFVIIRNHIMEIRWQEQSREFAIELDRRDRERNEEIQRYANLALNPLRVRCINFITSRFSATDLLAILVQHDDFLAIRFAIGSELIINHNTRLEEISRMIVEDDIVFQMPNETTTMSVNITSDEMLRWIIQNISLRRRDLQNIPPNERSSSYLHFEINERGDIVHRIIRR